MVEPYLEERRRSLQMLMSIIQFTSDTLAMKYPVQQIADSNFSQ